MIFGIGVDMVRIERMREGLARFGNRLPRRILSETEYSRFVTVRRQAAFLAQRFAAKEATAKALGTGFTAGVYPRDILVSSDKRGKPNIQFAGRTKSLADRLGIDRGCVSLSDEGDYAIAFVTLERAGLRPENSA